MIIVSGGAGLVGSNIVVALSARDATAFLIVDRNLQPGKVLG